MKRFTWLSIEPLLLFSLIVVALSSITTFWQSRPKPSTTDSKIVEVQEPAKPPLPQLPLGGREVFPDYRLIALYGTPGSRGLGVLGEQDPEASVARVKALAVSYQPLTVEKIMPCFEIITTVASASPTSDGNYSRELDVAKLLPWIEAAKAAGVYVILDLQPGRTDFATQAKQYEALLKEPHVGLALDPEWRLSPSQTHLKQIGSVDSAEINQTSAWLAALTKSHNLPQKIFLLHQFKSSMISRRELLDTSRAELAFVIQMDGQGPQPTKQETWRVIQENAPANIRFGWKNFYDEDKPMLTPEQTMQVQPVPWYVSYQ